MLAGLSTYNYELERDLSRRERLEISLDEDLSFKPKRNFKFESDADDDKTYGIDVSHHNGDIDWQKVGQAKVGFAYIKATQGNRFVDNRFEFNIDSARRERIPSSAYHFLSSTHDAPSQVDHFLRAYGNWHNEMSLPPVLDIEWHYNKSNNDMWRNKSRSEILDMCSAWLEKVESTLGVRPVIYTNKNWWEHTLRSSADQLQSYPIWMSRYGKFELDSPPIMDGFEWALWQFTDRGTLDGINGLVDVNWCRADFLPEISLPQVVETAAQRLLEYKSNNDPLSEDELKTLFVKLRAVFGSFSHDQVEFLNVLVETARPADLRDLINGSFDPRLNLSETASFFTKAADLFGSSSAENDTLKILLEISKPSAVRSLILKG